MKPILLAALGLLAFVAPAQAETACLQIGRIWSWKPLDNRTLIVEDELHRKFKVGLMGYCPRLPFKLDLEFKSNGAINGLDCVRKGDEVIERDTSGGYSCPVGSIAPYAPATDNSNRQPKSY